MWPSRLPVRLHSSRLQTALAVVAIALLGLAVRLYGLGGRVFHWDEGRVGYWTLRYAETGEFTYNPIIHGPFLRIVNASLFGVLPPTDGSARLIVAIVGGLLPLAAWLFRTRLDNAEVIALAVLLASNPLLIYYSRFMRNDVLVGAFAVIALGFAIRALDTRRVWYLYPSAAFLALSVTTKANTLLYVLCFAGAALLVVDQQLVRRVHENDNLWTVLVDRIHRVRSGVRVAASPYSPTIAVPVHMLGIGATFLTIVVFFFTPRPLLYTAFGSPAMWPGVVHEATIGSAHELVDLWITGDMQDNPYLEFLGHELETLAHGAAVVSVFAVVGFIVDGYVRETTHTSVDVRSRPTVKNRRISDTGEDTGWHTHGDGWTIEERTSADEDGTSADEDGTSADQGGTSADQGGTSAGEDVSSIAVPAGRSRAFVAFTCYWALASLIGYPAATDINAPWSAIHIVLPLTFPAAVGLAYIARETLYAVRITNRQTAILGGVVLLVVAGGLFAPTALYWNSANPDHTAVVQWSQPHNDLRTSLDEAEAVIDASDQDVDVLFVGADIASREGSFYQSNESVADSKPAAGGWYDRLPLPWYFERAGATVDSIPPDADHETALADPPPVVIAHADNRSAIDPHLNGYVDREHELRLWSFRIVVYVDGDVLATAGQR